MRVRDVKIKDFLSIGEVLVTFPSSGLVLLEGWNHDSDSANGAGKSSLLSAIAWCLFGKLPRDITATAVTRTGQKLTSVQATIDLPSGDVLEVTRKRPGGLEATLNSEIKITSQEELEAKLGLDYERYLHIAYFAQGLGSRFLDLSDTERKQVFVDLSRASNYSAAKEKVDAELKSISKEIQDLKLEQAKVSSRISELQDSIAPPEPIQEEIKKIDLQVLELNTKMSHISPQPPDTSKIRELKARLKQELNSVMEAKAELRSLHQQLRKISIPTTLPESISCPHCSGALLVSEDDIVACDIDAMQRSLEARQADARLKQDEIKAKILEVDEIVAKEPRILETIEKCDTKISDLSANYMRDKAAIEMMSSKISLLSSRREQLGSQLETIYQSRSRLLKLQSQESSIAADLIDRESRVLVLQAASLALGPSGIQAYVLDSIVEDFNAKINELLVNRWPRLKYELMTFKETKGSVSTRFSDFVSIDGAPRSIGSLSGGERRCLSVAIDLALTQVFREASGFMPSPIILDEPFDHLDSLNRERAVDMVQDLSSDTCVIVVDHQNETKGMFEHIIEVTKRSGVSSARIVSSNGG